MTIRVTAILATLLLGAGAAMAQQFPTRPVTLVSPNAAGGPNDLMARIIASKLDAKIGQPVIVENRVGGGSYTGGEYVARSAPDGHTLLVNAYSGLQQELFTKGLPVAQTKELTPVAPISEVPYLLFGPASLPAKDLKEFIAHVKANPGKLNYASFPSTASALEMWTFVKEQALPMEQINYNSTAVIITAMLRDEVHIYNGGIGGPRAQIEAGKLRGFAVLSTARDPSLPNVPTAKELGFDWVSSVYYTVLAPVRTPAPVVKFLNEKILEVLADPEVKDRFAKAGFAIAPPATPQAMAARLAREAAFVEKAAKAAGIEPR